MDKLPHLVFKNGSFYFIARLDNGRRKWIHIGRTMAEAFPRWLELYRPLEVHRCETVGQTIAYFLKFEGPRLKPRTVLQYALQAKSLLPVFGDALLTDVQPPDIAAYLRHRGGVIANREIAFLSSVYSLAIEAGWCQTNPCRGIRRKNPERKTGGRYVQPSEIEKLIAVAPASVVKAVKLVLLTGMRLGQVLTLSSEHVTDGGLVVPHAKGGKQTRLRWTDALREAVGDVSGVHVPVVATRDGKFYTPDGFSTVFYHAKKKAGVSFRFHDLRHSALTDAENAGGIGYAQALAGHRSPDITQRYLHNAFKDVDPLGK